MPYPSCHTVTQAHLIHSQADAVHEELVIECRNQATLQSHQTIIASDGPEGVQGISVVDTVLTTGLQRMKTEDGIDKQTNQGNMTCPVAEVDTNGRQILPAHRSQNTTAITDAADFTLCWLDYCHHILDCCPWCLTQLTDRLRRKKTLRSQLHNLSAKQSATTKNLTMSNPSCSQYTGCQSGCEYSIIFPEYASV